MARDDRYWQTSFQSRDSWRDRRRPGPLPASPDLLKPAPVPPAPPAAPTPRRQLPEWVCPGPCNARWRRAQNLLDAYDAAVAAWEANPSGEPPAEPQTPPVSPRPGDPVFCQGCQSQIRQELAELSDLAAVADAENTGHRKGPDADRVSGSKHAPSPSPVCDDLDELASVLRSWEALAKGDEESAARAGYLMSEIATLVARLGSIHFTRLISDPGAAPEFAREIRQWHKHLKDDVTRTGTGRRQMKRPCPRCERYSLVEEDGADYIECQNPACRRLLSREEFRALDEAPAPARGTGRTRS